MKDFYDLICHSEQPTDILHAICRFLNHLCSLEGEWMQLRLVEQLLQKEKIACSDARDLLMKKYSEICQLVALELEEHREFGVFKKNLFLWDWIFLKILITTGGYGKSIAKQINNRLEKNLLEYQQKHTLETALESWFILDNRENYFCSPIFLILTEVVWSDCVRKSWERKKKALPR